MNSTPVAVDAYRGGRWWMISVPSLDGLTQALSLDEVEGQARDYVALALDCDPNEVALAVRYWPEGPTRIVAAEGTNLDQVINAAEDVDVVLKRGEHLAAVLMSASRYAALLDRLEAALDRLSVYERPGAVMDFDQVSQGLLHDD